MRPGCQLKKKWKKAEKEQNGFKLSIRDTIASKIEKYRKIQITKYSLPNLDRCFPEERSITIHHPVANRSKCDCEIDCTLSSFGVWGLTITITTKRRP